MCEQMARDGSILRRYPAKILNPDKITKVPFKHDDETRIEGVEEML
jgi:hypothetical protein